MEKILENFKSAFDAAYSELGKDLAKVHHLVNAFAYGFSVEEAVTLLGSDFNKDQVNEIMKAISKGVSLDKVKQYADPKYSFKKLHYIFKSIIRKDYNNEEKEKLISIIIDSPDNILGLVDDDLELYSLDQISLYANSYCFNDKQIIMIRRALEKELTIDQIKLFAIPEFNHSQMNQILCGFVLGLSREQVESYAKSSYSKEQMQLIRRYMMDKNKKALKVDLSM